MEQTAVYTITEVTTAGGEIWYEVAHIQDGFLGFPSRVASLELAEKLLERWKADQVVSKKVIKTIT